MIRKFEGNIVVMKQEIDAARSVDALLIERFTTLIQSITKGDQQKITSDLLIHISGEADNGK